MGPGERSVAEEVEQSIRLLMSAGRATIGEVAHSLGTNVRTLQRRLEEEESCFSDLLDRVRIQQVSHHFTNRQLRLTDVAHLLGYSSLASFSCLVSQSLRPDADHGQKGLAARRAPPRLALVRMFGCVEARAGIEPACKDLQSSA